MGFCATQAKCVLQGCQLAAEQLVACGGLIAPGSNCVR